MALDMRKNQDALLKAYKAILDDTADTDWAVFGYEGQTTVLKLVARGDGGLEEMADELSGSKIMYAYCKVLDPNTNLPKYVLISWQGEGAPETMKFKCANHLKDMQNFLRPVHITIHARNEDDVDKDVILDKVSKGSGANYSFHQEKPKKPEKDGPIGSVYQRTVATRDINQKRRDEFWAQEEKEEQIRVAEERRKALAEKHQREVERKEREIREAKFREEQLRSREKVITEQRKLERRASQQDQDDAKKQWEREQEAAYKEEAERGRRSDVDRLNRVKEAQSLTSSATANARAIFRRRESESLDEGLKSPTSKTAPPPRVIRQGFLNQDPVQQPLPARKQPIQLPTGGDNQSSVSPPLPASPPRNISAVSQPSKPARVHIPEQIILPEPVQEPEEVFKPEPTPPAPVQSSVRHEEPPRNFQQPDPSENQPKTRNLLKEGLPPRQESDEEEEDNWDDDEEKSPSVPAVKADNPSFSKSEINRYQEERAQPEEYFQGEPDMNDQSYGEEHPAQDAVYEQNGQQEGDEDPGMCARALYDYQAEDESEITFLPDDIITNIDQIDAGWWMGKSPSGQYGMFPANYVEML